MTMFFTQIYIYDNNENIYMLILKKKFKNVYAFFIKLLATSKQLIRRNSICCLKNQVIFHRVNIEIGLNPRLWETLKSLIKRGLLEEIEGVNDNFSAFMHLNKE